MDYQHTINSSFNIHGIGLHSGIEVNLIFKPAEENSGILFKRIDLIHKPIVKAQIDNLYKTERNTSLEKNNIKIKTVEHLLAACCGLKIDNLIIEIDSEELPILDGSSIEYIRKFESVGLIKQKSIRNYFKVEDKVLIEDPKNGSKIEIIPSNKFSIDVSIDYESKSLNKERVELNSLAEFKNQFANARTFCFFHEIKPLLSKGLIKGGSLKNAIVFLDDNVSKTDMLKLKKYLGIKNITISNKGYLNNIDELYYDDEACRHKLLDLIGDLYLLGRPLIGKVIAYKPGHYMNTKFTKILHKKMNENMDKKNSIDNPIMDINKIMEILPHRPPFLFIDKILSISKSKVVGLKNVTMNEQFFMGHFPKKPVLPGVIQIEAMAQVGGILVLSSVPDPKNYLTYFMKIDKVKFKQLVVPGDTIIFNLELISPIRRGICHMFGQGYVEDKLVIEGELMAQIKKIN